MRRIILTVAVTALLALTAAVAYQAGQRSPAPTPSPTTPTAGTELCISAPAVELSAQELGQGRYRLVNATQKMEAEFSAEGLRASVVDSEATGSWSMRAAAYGYGETMSDLPAAEPRAMDSYLEFVRDTVIEWYINKADGIEQGFTIIAPPTGGDGCLPLALRLDIDSDLTLEVQEASAIATLRDDLDRTVLSMSDFFAYDATGSRLPIRIMNDGGTALRFEVDDRRAVYPVTIDPIFRHGEIVPITEWVEDNGDGSFTASFGYLNTVGSWSDADISAWKDRRAGQERYETLLAQVALRQARAAAGRPGAIAWLNTNADLIAALTSLEDYQEYRWQQFLAKRPDAARERILNGRTVNIGYRNNFFTPDPRRRGQPRQFLAGRQVEAFTVIFTENNITWNLNGATAIARQSDAWKSVRPVLEYVQQRGDGSYTAHFGYLNENRNPVEIPIGALNNMTPNGPDRGQETLFQVGRVYDAFTVNFSGGNLVWTLTGPNGSRRTATAGAGTARPFVGEVIHIFVDGPIYQNWDGSYTATFGYWNKNDETVTIPVGAKNRLSPSQYNDLQTTVFEAGRWGGAWQVTWDGSHNIVWTLTSPDGRTRTTTAGIGNAIPYVRQPVSPVLEDIEVFSDGTVIAHWGYFNRNAHPVIIQIGGNNTFTPGHDVGQPESFAAGRNVRVFSTVITGTTVWRLDGRSATAGWPLNAVLYFENFTMQYWPDIRRPIASFGWINRAGNSWDATYAAEHPHRQINTGRRSVNSFPYQGDDAVDGGLYTSNNSTNQLLYTAEYQALDISQISTVRFQQSSNPGSKFYLTLKVDDVWYCAAEPWLAPSDSGSTDTMPGTFSLAQITVTDLPVIRLTKIAPSDEVPGGLLDLNRNQAAMALPTQGQVQAFGIYFHRKDGTANKRTIDEFEIIGSRIPVQPAAPEGVSWLPIRKLMLN